MRITHKFYLWRAVSIPSRHLVNSKSTLTSFHSIICTSNSNALRHFQYFFLLLLMPPLSQRFELYSRRSAHIINWSQTFIFLLLVLIIYFTFHLDFWLCFHWNYPSTVNLSQPFCAFSTCFGNILQKLLGLSVAFSFELPFNWEYRITVSPPLAAS